jgi:acyl carrier protein
MSLDIVELIVEIEDKFGVTIPDRDAERIRTVGNLYQYLLGCRNVARRFPGPEVCPSSATFYRARRALCAQLGLARRSVTPSSVLAELIPEDQRRSHWQQLRAALRPFNLPGLQRPGWLRIVLPFGWIAQVAASVGACLEGRPLLAAVILACAALYALLGYLLTRPLAVCVPDGCGTMRGLVCTALHGNRDEAYAALGRMSERELWNQLCHTIGTQLGIDPALLTPETDFVDDLGA